MPIRKRRIRIPLLLSGKVKVDADGQTVILDPGMQSVVNDERRTPGK